MKNLTEVSKAVAKIHGFSNAKALEVTRTVLDCIKKGIVELEQNSRDRVSLADFGNFAVKATSKRTVKNIRTGEPVEVPAGVRIIFKPAENFKAQVASGEFELNVPERGKKEETEESSETEEKEKSAKKAAKKAAQKSVEAEEIPDLGELEDL